MNKQYKATILRPFAKNLEIDMLEYFDEEELNNLPHVVILSRFEKEMIKKFPDFTGTLYPNLWSEEDERFHVEQNNSTIF